MLLPDKHVALAESLLGLGAFLLDQLNTPRSLDQLHSRVASAALTDRLPAYHDFDSIFLTVLFLYSIGAVEMTDAGRLRKCAS